MLFRSPDLGRAWRQYDVFGESEVIAVPFSYSATEHTLLGLVNGQER